MLATFNVYVYKSLTENLLSGTNEMLSSNSKLYLPGIFQASLSKKIAITLELSILKLKKLLNLIPIPLA